jgi:hypothetical protein
MTMVSKTSPSVRAGEREEYRDAEAGGRRRKRTLSTTKSINVFIQTRATLHAPPS